MVRLVAIQAFVLSVLALGLNGLRGVPLVPLAAGPRLFAACLAAVLIAAATVGLTRAAARAGVGWVLRLEAHIRRTLGPLDRGEILVLSIVGPLGEELFFRGMLQPALVSGFRSQPAGILLATVLFALLHTTADRGGEPVWTWPAFALALGGILGVLFAATGNLLPPLLLHVLINAGNLARIARPAGR
jgi:membrane protease YdiL (CAAX protease family)